MIPRT